MKKFLFLLLLLGAAVYWGFSQGNALTQPDTHPPVTAKAQTGKDDGVLSEVTDMITTLISGLSSNETAEGRVDIAPSTGKESPISSSSELATVQDKFYVLSHFKESLESRINRNQFIPADKMPDLLKKAVVATEDRRFYEHGAVDVIGVGRALFTNYIAGRTVEGGSTISQQVVKNIFLSQERTMTRKAEELALAIQLERNYTKDEILEIYLNTIYFGHGTYGVKAASETYFGKHLRDLTLSECAMLAGLPQAPSAYDPISHPQEAKKRMITVLALMAEQGVVTAQEAASAAAETLLK